jgi:hypothetical protein
MNIIIKRLLFYWTTSFSLATAIYYILWAIMPNNYVFGALIRMFLYHWEHPITFIAIPCFFYGIIATLLADKFSKQNVLRQVLLTIMIIVFTVIVSSPFGGMLWHYYDMKAGYFPTNWVGKMAGLGFEWGLEIGWLVVVLSIPYNIIGSIGCYFLTKKGSELFKTK